MPSDERRERRKQFEQKIRENDKVKRLGPRVIPEVDSGSLPRPIALALRDEKKAAVISSARRLMNYHTNLGALRRKKFRGEVISAEEQARIRKESEGMQDEFRSVLRNSAQILREDQWLAAHAAAVGEAPEDAELWENLPDYFTDEELETLSYMGVNKDQRHAEWQKTYGGLRAEDLATLNQKTIEQALLDLEQRADSITFPESAGNLEKEGLLSIGGDEDAVSTFVTVALIIAFGVPVLEVESVTGTAIVVVGIKMAIEDSAPPSNCVGEQIIRLHFKILTTPDVPVDDMLASMQQVYAAQGFRVLEASREYLNLPLLNDLDIGPEATDVTADMDRLFANRNNVGSNDVAIYFVRSTQPPVSGCTRPGPPNIVVTQAATTWTLGHETGHVLGLTHVDDNDRLMTGNGTEKISNPPPDIVESEKETVCASDYTVPV